MGTGELYEKETWIHREVENERRWGSGEGRWIASVQLEIGDLRGGNKSKKQHG